MNKVEGIVLIALFFLVAFTVYLWHDYSRTDQILDLYKNHANVIKLLQKIR